MEPNEKMLEDVVKKFEAKLVLLSKYGDALTEITKAENEGRISNQEADENIAFIAKDTMNAVQTIKGICMGLAVREDLSNDELIKVRTYYHAMEEYEKQLKEVLGS